MTDQPTPGNDGAPKGQQPPSYQPPPHRQSDAPDYGQPPWPYGTPPAAPGQSYGAPDYGQPPYGQRGSPYNAYGQPVYYPLPPEPKGLSIASLCCGITVYLGFGVFILPQLAAVFLGHLALRREPAGRGMAIAGLVLGYVGIAITVLVIGLLVALGMTAASYGGYRV
ncbi:DUF4190 domain-containing protein [Arthrobacter sp. PAMC25284]|uniref:DUF4190 domain-containing protein n=1 Tax=Arthrobacter sp. PAMC25284 TaxID=2861279 RepID=UPI001C630552|nr:DUF4190 domain-containing protein [Arthrobacter sp. PAMC25284]QYF88788.1 DUF4190 domain-containing protein [Arthrobacter sp. PAMC25284]